MGGTAVAEDDAQQHGPRRAGLRPRNVVLLAVGIVIVIAVALLNVIHVPVAILRPGPVQNIFGEINGKPVLQISGAKTYPTSGTLDFTTVSMAGGPQYPVSVMEWIGAKFDHDAEIDPASMWFQSGVSGKQVQQQNTSEMTDAQQTAKVVALRASGLKVPEVIKVAMVADNAASGKLLKVGDVIVSINKTAIDRLDTVAQVMGKVKPGAKVAMVVSRNGEDVRLSVPTADNSGRAVFGIGITPSYTFPAKVNLNVGDVGGPSAGTMLSLAIYDKLTPGSLTGGKKFAGTGTISEDGVVGPIGGLRQKLAGARSAGAQYFLAPASDCSQAKGHVPAGLTVIKISSFGQAVSVVKKVAAGQTTGLPGC
ncbi:YlbL family protein [Leekyejoonella antrihumi]|uniref:endopeptidase La n=1 Tax=Leekyejoonella antrihumi TaxID=1660198 RepID=A0A563DYW1_9MICO|nr:PDZ domain-containing protein [Leekyejoonella antrihumi]TWP35309.1 PDZ domain-containing protein [Leekyejoonella antrihumi]